MSAIAEVQALIVVMNGWDEDDDTLTERLQSRVPLDYAEAGEFVRLARAEVEQAHADARAVEAEHDLGASNHA